ncbi:MAG: DUF2807 domain-containing protein [Clostridia bacterium]|nr:DUF2807 domain-containing protein [Clostridia bacterium]
MRKKRCVRYFAGVLVCLGLLFGLCGCGSGSALSSSWRIVRLKEAVKTVTVPLSYDAAEGLTLAVDMRFTDGGKNPVTVLAPDAEEAPYAVLCYPADLEDYGFAAEAEGNVLRISAADKYQFSTDAFSVTVYADVSAYRLTGSIALQADAGGIAQQQLSLSVAGGADCDLTGIAAEAVVLAVSGAADITLAGTAQKLDAEIKGAGALDAAELSAQHAAVAIYGAGAAEVMCAQTLDAEINGAGSIVYRGNPTVTKKINGAGAVQAAADSENKS